MLNLKAFAELYKSTNGFNEIKIQRDWKKIFSDKSFVSFQLVTFYKKKTSKKLQFFHLQKLFEKAFIPRIECYEASNEKNKDKLHVESYSTEWYSLQATLSNPPRVL